jgi:DNA-binding winged helix-turn-helix (wHTH) protein
MQALSLPHASTAFHPVSLHGDPADWILVVHAPPRTAPAGPMRGSAFSASSGVEIFADRELDLHSLRWRPPRALVIEATTAAADAAGLARFLVESWLGGTIPTVLAAPLDVVGDIDDVPVDDFVVAPYSRSEIATRIRRIERRRQAVAVAADAAERRIEVGSLVIDTAAHHVEAEGRPAALTRLEYALLLFLVQNPGRVYTRDELLARVWGNGGPAGGRTVDIHVRRLRAKLGRAVASLVTVRGVGYRFHDHAEVARPGIGRGERW